MLRAQQMKLWVGLGLRQPSGHKLTRSMPKMHLSTYAVLATVLALETAATHALLAQDSAAIRAGQIGTLVRTERHAGDAVEVLTQRKARQSPAVVDAIADTLVAIALTERGNGPESIRMRGVAVLALALAGQGKGATPYSGAGDRLYRIAIAAPVGTRGRAVGGLAQLADTGQALVLLRKIAILDDVLAVTAVNLLGLEMGRAGRTAARELFLRDLVVNEIARSGLEGMAREYGWRR